MKTCYTCQSRIEIRATRCPYCTTEIDLNGFPIREYKPAPDSPPIPDDTYPHIFLFFAMLALMYWTGSPWVPGLYLMFYIVKFVALVVAGVKEDLRR